MNRIRILILVGGTQYGVVRRFAYDLKAGFENRGCIVDLWDGDIYNAADTEKYRNQGHDFIIVFNHIYQDVSDMFIKDRTTIVWSFLLDPPVYHLGSLQTQSSENVIVSFIDRNHAAYAEKELKHLPYITFMPHGGSRPEKIASYASSGIFRKLFRH